MIRITYSKKSQKFLDKHPKITKKGFVEPLLIKAYYKITKTFQSAVDVKKIQGVGGDIWRVRKGDIRIIFTVSFDGTVTVLATSHIGWRGTVYKNL